MNEDWDGFENTNGATLHPYIEPMRQQYEYGFNQFFVDAENGDRRWQFRKIKMNTYQISDFKVSDRVQFPCLVAYRSIDSFARGGKVEAELIHIFPLDVTAGITMFM